MRRFGKPGACWRLSSLCNGARLMSGKDHFFRPRNVPPPPKVPSDGNGTNPGVLATKTMLECVAAMDSQDARLLAGVPYRENVEANRLLLKHCNTTPDASFKRYSLVCNTGPTGVGKSMLQCQNMLDATKAMQCLSVYVDFNGQQKICPEERDLKFEARVALRIAWYYREEEPGSATDVLFDTFEDFSKHKIEHCRAEVEKMTIKGTVAKLKAYHHHTGSVFLAVDELKMSAESVPGMTEEAAAYKNLSYLSKAMDNSIEFGSKDERIYLAVSVYDAVSLAELATASRRSLLLQPTPPVFPLWVERSSVDTEAIQNLPLALRIFFNEAERDIFYNARLLVDNGDEVVVRLISSLADLVFKSAGHGRRVEALVGKFRELPSCEYGGDVSEASDALLKYFAQSTATIETWHSDVTEVMNLRMDLRCIAPSLSEAASRTGDAPLFLAHLMQGLFSAQSISEKEQPLSRCTHMRLASLHHYGLLGPSSQAVGYLPMETVLELCRGYKTRCKLTHGGQVTAKEIALVEFTELAAAECLRLVDAKEIASATLLARSEARGRGVTPVVAAKNVLSKAFERAMMYTLCAASISGRKLTEMVCRSGGSAPGVSAQLQHIRVREGVASFPCVCKWRNGKPETRTSIDATLIKEITAVGQKVDDLTHGLAFMPTEQYNLCCDFVLVLPKETGGRVVLLVQCKHWFGDQVSGAYAFDNFRWGQQFMEHEKVYPTMRKPCDEVHNAAFRHLVKIRKEPGTEIRYVLLTVNEAPSSPTRDMKTTLSGSPQWNIQHTLKDAARRESELFMNLQHMRGWCPTVAYSALMGLQVRDLWTVEPPFDAMVHQEPATADAQDDQRKVLQSIPKTKRSKEKKKQQKKKAMGMRQKKKSK